MTSFPTRRSSDIGDEAVTIAIAVAVSIGPVAVVTVAVGASVTVPPAAIEQRGQSHVQRSRHAFERAESGQDTAVLDAGDVSARQMRREGQLLLCETSLLAPSANSRGDLDRKS